jgi:asparagine synthase (glutamine-hydrolysing)
MCGISGIFSRTVLKTSLIHDSIERISHRGPDESGFFKNDYCSLGMCRLAIIDIVNGKQPSLNASKDIISVFNGEIYNFSGLIKLLESKGRKIDVTGDSALIPYLYEEFGLEFVSYLQGMFAIAILDTRNRQLILVRDRLGKKPLWYCAESDRLSFSSELKGLLALGVKKTIDLQNIQEYLSFGYINAPRSPFQNVNQLEPASLLRFSEAGVEIRKYWNTNSIKPLRISFEDAKAETTRLLEDAVKSRMISERPIGAFLSGGIDSTIVSALMARISDSKIHTFSVGFDDTKFDESRHAKRVANSLGTYHHERIVEPDPVFIVETVARTLDSPFADSSIIPTFLLSQFARERVVVALSGDGGDEGFGGYQRYKAALYLDKINLLLHLNPFTKHSYDSFSNDRLRKLMKHLSPKSIEVRYRDFQSLFLEKDLTFLLNPDILHSNANSLFSEMWLSILSKDLIRKMQELDIHSYLPGDLLYKVDMASMANSLEVRSPFLDYRVVEFGLSLPAHFKFSNCENKHLLREIARGLVPREMIDRPKMGFGIPRARWLRNELKEIVSDVLLSSSFRDRGWFNFKNVEKIIMAHNHGKNLDNLIWPMLMLELWARHWVD